MIVTPIEFDLDLAKALEGYHRTPGLHMSDIYDPLFKELEPERYGRTNIDAETKAGYQGMGLAFEEILEKALAERLAGSGRPGEIVEPDTGIIYSPDLLIFNSHTRLGEIKLTWMSMREAPTEVTNGFPVKFDKYLVQMKAYCRCLETPYARLYCLFINGDYDYKGKGLKPTPRCWDIEFSKRELHENWQMLMNYAKQRKLL